MRGTPRPQPEPPAQRGPCLTRQLHVHQRLVLNAAELQPRVRPHRQRDPLPLAARELVRVAVAQHDPAGAAPRRLPAALCLRIHPLLRAAADARADRAGDGECGGESVRDLIVAVARAYS